MALQKRGKDEEWLFDELKKQGIDKYSEVFWVEYMNNSLILTAYKLRPRYDHRKA